MWHMDSTERTAPWNLWAAKKRCLFISPGLDGTGKLHSSPGQPGQPLCINSPLCAEDTRIYIAAWHVHLHVLSALAPPSAVAAISANGIISYMAAQAQTSWSSFIPLSSSHLLHWQVLWGPLLKYILSWHCLLSSPPPPTANHHLGPSELLPETPADLSASFLVPKSLFQRWRSHQATFLLKTLSVGASPWRWSVDPLPWPEPHLAVSRLLCRPIVDHTPPSLHWLGLPSGAWGAPSCRESFALAFPLSGRLCPSIAEPSKSIVQQSGYLLRVSWLPWVMPSHPTSISFYNHLGFISKSGIILITCRFPCISVVPVVNILL